MCSIVGLRTILAEINCPQQTTIIFTDNEGSYNSIKNPINTRLRHVNMRYHRIRQAVINKDIEVRQLSMKDMLADSFTKNLTTKGMIKSHGEVMGNSPKPNLPDDLKQRLGLTE